jgi:hypothetical protein
MERRELSETLAAPKQCQRTGRGVLFFVEPDPRMRDYLVPSARFRARAADAAGKRPCAVRPARRARPEVVLRRSSRRGRRRRRRRASSRPCGRDRPRSACSGCGRASSRSPTGRPSCGCRRRRPRSRTGGCGSSPAAWCSAGTTGRSGSTWSSTSPRGSTWTRSRARPPRPPIRSRCWARGSRDAVPELRVGGDEPGEPSSSAGLGWRGGARPRGRGSAARVRLTWRAATSRARRSRWCASRGPEGHDLAHHDRERAGRRAGHRHDGVVPRRRGGLREGQSCW